MRLHFFAALAGLSLVQCSFDATGLSGNSSPSLPEDTSTGDPSSTSEPTSDPTGTVLPTVCGDTQIEGEEECDNGELNNGGGGLCKADCTLNSCGDGYVAPAIEGCDDGNNDDGDGCSATCTLEGCGDGVKAGKEECDDGNKIDTDGCSSLCRLPFCGDGKVNGGDECDEGEANSDVGACLADCTTATCGDGFVQEGVEACDDGNAVDDDACSNTCKSANCGDGVQQAGEACDDGADNGEDKACLPECIVAVCGDGFLLAGEEECDDGNVMAGDGCSATCIPEECGNGIVELEEACDDGNDDDTDDCLNTCVVAICGDGVVAANADVPEQCDDNNGNNNDDCPSTCKHATCGDGFVWEGNEPCDGMSPVCSNDCKRSNYYIFTSSSKFSGATVTSLMAADMACTALAQGKPIAGKYKAWLGDGAMTAASRLHPSTVPYILPNNAKVADNWTDLTDGSLDVAIGRTETGTVLNPNPAPNACDHPQFADAAVWTGALPSGASADSCENWSDATTMKEGQFGLHNRNDMLWSGCKTTCDMQARLYCIEQPPL